MTANAKPLSTALSECPQLRKYVAYWNARAAIDREIVATQTRLNDLTDQRAAVSDAIDRAKLDVPESYGMFVQ